jgi:DUF4097 and DUF4098 domain-containing protein YvlB
MEKFDRIQPVTVALRSARGIVDVTAADDVPVVVDVTPMDGSDGAAEAARQTRVVLEGDTLYIQTPQSSGWNWRRNPKLRIAVQVPTDSGLAVKTASADVRATGRYSVAQIDVASADVEVEEVAGDAYLKASSGDLAIARVGGGLKINTASGELRVGDVTGDAIAESASGDIEVRSVGGSLRAATASGDVTVGVVRRGRVELKSASGDIEVGVAAGTGVWLDVATASGTTRNDLAVTGGTPPAGQDAPQLELRIRTASGDIEIRRVLTDLHAAA